MNTPIDNDIAVLNEPLSSAEWAQLRLLITRARRYALERAVQEPNFGKLFAPVAGNFEFVSRSLDQFASVFEARVRMTELGGCCTCTCACDEGEANVSLSS